MENRVPLTMEKTDHEDPYTHLSEDHLTVNYTYDGPALGMEGMVQPADPAPVQNVVYYFEVEVKSAGLLGKIAAGFATEGWLDRHGFEYKKCYYHGDTGLIHRLQGNNLNGIAAEDTADTGQSYTTNDIVGCGINFNEREFFFTKNGRVVGRMAMVFEGLMYPTVTMHSNEEKATVNFTGPFAFNLPIRYFWAKVEDVPTVMEKTDHEDPYTHLSEDHLTVNYTYDGPALDMEGMVQPANLAPVERVAYYFEIQVKSRGFLGRIAAGFATGGWLDRYEYDYKKCYYHGDNGLIRRQQGNNLNGIAEDADFTGQSYTTNDIVGCGINYVDREFFFTLVGTMPMFDTSLYPTVTMHSNGEEVTVNFTGPFTFDFQAHREAILANVEYPLP